MRLLKLLTITATILTFTAHFAPDSQAADFTEPSSGMEFKLIKGGSFMMGDIYDNDNTAKPTHKVTIANFYIGIHEVTFAQYDEYCAEAKCEKPSDEGWGRGNRPVINVTWQDAVAYTQWLSKKANQTFRLPSEAEWEYAARAGTSTNFWWGNTPGVGMANCRGCFPEWSKQSMPVGSFPANPWGLYDMNGNVYEWVADDFHPDYTNAPSDGTPWLDGDKSQKLSRGGNWFYDAEESTAYKRCYDTDRPYYYQGFRVVLEP